MKLFLVRHGETHENRDRISQGHSDGTLTRKGKVQSSKLAKRLLTEKIEVIYCSDLGRCKDTILPFTKKSKIPIVFTDRLRERNSGVFQGRPHEEMKKWYSDFLKENKVDSYSIRPPKGESYYDLMDRIGKFVEWLRKKEAGKNVLLVSHGGPLVAVMLHLFGQSPQAYYKKYRQDNASLTIVSLNDFGKPRISLLCSTKHLD